MPWTVEYDAVDDVVIVRTAGVLKLVELDDALRHAVDESRAHRCDRFLCDDTRGVMQLTYDEVSDYPNHYRRHGLPQDARFAVVFTSSSAFTVLFAQAIRHHGFAAGRVCYSMDDAWRWLRQH